MSGVFLGVDGGGTKTAFCLLDSDGVVLSSYETVACYHPGRPDRVAEVLSAGVRAVLAQAHCEEVDFAFFGLPGYGEISSDVALLDELPAQILGHRRYAVDNDAVCGWAGSLGGEDGINVVSGTGSIAYARHSGRGVRVGGWGEGFGDEGSGHWLGVAALQLFSRMSDGRVASGPLLTILREHLGLKTDLDLVDVVINQWQRDRTRVAALSRPLVRAAREGDAAAAVLLEDAGVELARLVGAAHRSLGFTGLVPVSYSGGVFSVPEVRDAFAARLDTEFDLRKPLFGPSVGAARYAAGLAGSPIVR